MKCIQFCVAEVDENINEGEEVSTWPSYEIILSFRSTELEYRSFASQNYITCEIRLHHHMNVAYNLSAVSSVRKLHDTEIPAS